MPVSGKAIIPMLNAEPARSRIQTQKEYGIPADEEGMVPWNRVVEQLQSARNFWLVTVRPDGRPHAVRACGLRACGRLRSRWLGLRRGVMFTAREPAAAEPR